MKTCKTCWWNQGPEVQIDAETWLYLCGYYGDAKAAHDTCDHHLTQDEYDRLNPVPEMPEPDIDEEYRKAEETYQYKQDHLNPWNG